jgi:hypothetical protein
MNTGIGVTILTGVLPLVGVLIGAGATVSVQRSSARAAHYRFAAESLQAKRGEVKSSVVSYLEIVQHLQTQLDAREKGDDVPDLRSMVEQVWLAQKQLDIICSEQLREPLVQHATALHKVTRHEAEYPDWWTFVTPFQGSLLEAMRVELGQSYDWQRSAGMLNLSRQV